jgi:hypothetical protein
MPVIYSVNDEKNSLKKSEQKDNERKPCEFFTTQINNGQIVEVLENISDITWNSISRIVMMV